MLSVVIPAYNEQNLIGLCLDSLCRQNTDRTFEVIVVNNASTDATKNVAEGYAGKLRIRVIDEPTKGRGTARATGFRHARGNMIFSTDADVIVPPDWIESFAAILEKHPSYVGVGGSMRTYDCGAVHDTFFNVFHPLFMPAYSLVLRHTLLPGFNFAIRRDAYEKSGGFNANINCQEDVDLSMKMRKVGRVLYDRQTCVQYSGRRFRDKGVLTGYFEYIKTFYTVIIRRKYDGVLSDPR